MPRLLIADGDANLRDFLREELTDAGFSVSTVSNGKQVIDSIGGQTFDLILMDLTLPDMDGIDVMARLKKNAPNIPILGMTAYVGRGNIARAMDYDVTTLTKPLVITNLIERINGALKKV